MKIVPWKLNNITLFRALQAPHNEKTLRGRSLRISPADSWHQPAEEADGRVRWKPSQREEVADDTSKSDRSENTEQQDCKLLNKYLC